MAKQKGIIKIKGTIQGLCYYKLNGKDIIRKASGPSKERINSDPAFVNVKANNQEFRAAVLIAKSIIRGLGPMAKKFRDTYMQSRLTGICCKIIQNGDGRLGQREANLCNKPNELIGFQLNKSQSFSKIYTAQIQITYNKQQNDITIIIPKSRESNLNIRPKNASHFILTLAVSIVSTYQWKEIVESYHPLQPDQNALGVIMQSQPLLVNAEHQNMIMKVPVPIKKTSKIAFTVWMGIDFGQELKGKYIEIETVRAMEHMAIL